MRLVADFDADVGDARGVIAHPLEVGDDVQHRRQASQVGGHRLLGGDLQQRRFFDLETLAIDQDVFGFERSGGDRIAGAQGVDRAGDGFFDHAAEDEDLVLELARARDEIRSDWC